MRDAETMRVRTLLEGLLAQLEAREDEIVKGQNGVAFTPYREGLADGYGRSARMVRALLSDGTSDDD